MKINLSIIAKLVIFFSINTQANFDYFPLGIDDLFAVHHAPKKPLALYFNVDITTHYAFLGIAEDSHEDGEIRQLINEALQVADYIEEITALTRAINPESSFIDHFCQRAILDSTGKKIDAHKVYLIIHKVSKEDSTKRLLSKFIQDKKADKRALDDQDAQRLSESLNNEIDNVDQKEKILQSINESLKKIGIKETFNIATKAIINNTPPILYRAAIIQADINTTGIGFYEPDFLSAFEGTWYDSTLNEATLNTLTQNDG